MGTCTKFFCFFVYKKVILYDNEVSPIVENLVTKYWIYLKTISYNKNTTLFFDSIYKSFNLLIQDLNVYY